MIIDMRSIARITNNGEFTSIELTSGDVIHTAYEGYHASISIVDYTFNDELLLGLSIDMVKSE